mgnify:CR=1 FL=1
MKTTSFWGILLLASVCAHAGNDDWVENELIVRLPERLAIETAMAGAVGPIQTAEVLLSHAGSVWWRVRLSDLADPRASAGKLMQANPALFAEPNYRIHGALIPDDTYYLQGLQYSLGHGSAAFFPSGVHDIGAETAWNVSTGHASVSVAILDSGIDIDHPDLWSQLWSNPLEVFNGLDDDSNGFVDDLYGWDFVNSDADPSDDNGHGTQVAGVIAARGNDAVGVAGIAWNCPVMSIKILDDHLTGSIASAVAGIAYAVQQGASVINCSFTASNHDPALWAAIDAASTAGINVVGAAGNDAQNEVKYPAAYAEVLSVGALTCSGTIADFSNHGLEIDLFAPGVSVFQSTWMENGLRNPYAGSSGTSMACPHASAGAALLRSYHLGDPTWTAGFIAAHLIHTASVFTDPEGNSRKSIDLGAALTAVPQPDLIASVPEVTPFFDMDSDGRFDPGDIYDFTFSIRNEWADAESVIVTLLSTHPDLIVTNNPQLAGHIGFGQNVPVSFRIDADDDAVYGETYLLTVVIQPASGAMQSSELRVTLGPRELSGGVYGILGPGAVVPARHYQVISPIVVAPATALMVEPGVRIMFQTGTGLSVFGELSAVGAPGDLVIFEGAEDAIWDGIRFMPGSVSAVYSSMPPDGIFLGGSILEWCRFENGNPAVSCASEGSASTASPYISRCTFMSSEMGLKMSGANSTCVDRCLFNRCLNNLRFEDLASSTGGSPTILRCTTIGDASGGTQNISAYELAMPYTAAPVIQQSNIFGANPLGGFDYYAYVPANPPVWSFPAMQNYWGPYTTAQLPFGATDLIYDSYDIPTLVTVDTSGYLMDYTTEAPACLESVTLTPSGIVPMGPLHVDLVFSKEMNQAMPLSVTFGPVPDYDIGVFAGIWIHGTLWSGDIMIDESLAGTGGTQTIRISGMNDQDGVALPDDMNSQFTLSGSIEGVHGMAIMGKINSIDVSWDEEEEKRDRAAYSGHVVVWGTQSGVYTHEKRVPAPAVMTTLTVPDDIANGVTYFIGIRYYESDIESPPPYSYLGPVYAECVGETLAQSVAVPAVSIAGMAVLLLGVSYGMRFRSTRSKGPARPEQPIRLDAP